ncbi:mycothiol conjugate amidase Mca [Rarobacter incanus]|nr:mycothiol conjugate amidase Mca [Rarobacter incanus]
MAVHAHPDDESSKGAATTAKYSDESAEVLIVTCTGGERGDVLNPTFTGDYKGLEAMRELRQREMAQAREALGVSQVWLGFVDSGLPEGDPLPPLPAGSFAAGDLATEVPELVRLVRSFRPHVMTTYDPMGGYPHPDHIRTHQISVAAYILAAHPDYRPDLGEAWSVLKLYYNHDFSIARSLALHEAMLDAGLESPFGPWIDRRNEHPILERHATTRIDVDPWRNRRDAALRAHASQIDPGGFFFAVPRELESQVWPWEEFELASTRVPASIPEVDLFAGIDPEASDAELQAAAAGEGEPPIAGYEDTESAIDFLLPAGIEPDNTTTN